MTNKIQNLLAETGKKIVVLDDDPTGIQTVHDLTVYTRYDEALLLEGLTNEDPLFYILTNSRSLSEEATVKLHRALMRNLLAASQKCGKDFILILRGDSTLRGHFPLETQVIKEELEACGMTIDGEILCPYLEGIRKTENDVHYVLQNGQWIPCGESEFAKDKSFAYSSGSLRDYVEEKTHGQYSADSCISIPLELLHAKQTDRIEQLLLSADGFRKIIVNADCLEALKTFALALYPAMQKKRFLFRTAASFVQAVSGLETKPFLKGSELINESVNGGMVLVGSHVKKTADQLACLFESELPITPICFDQRKVLEGKLHEESLHVSESVNRLIAQGKTPVVYTHRERVDFPADDPAKQLEMANTISTELIGILERLEVKPRFLVTKGGITSSDALTQGLNVVKERVLGQIRPAIGVIETQDESKFPHLKVVIFPGNVGDSETLRDVVSELIRA